MAKKIKTTIARRHLQIASTAFNDVKTIRGGTVPSFVRVSESGDKTTFFTVTPDTNAALHIGPKFGDDETGTIFTFTTEDLKAILNHPEGMVDFVFTPEQAKFLATDNDGTRKIFRPSSTPQEDVTDKLKSMTKNKGSRLMTITADFLEKMGQVATSGMDVQADVTHRTMFKIESADTLNFFKYISETVSIFGKLPIANGDASHNGISAFKSVFAANNNFASAFNMFVQAAKGEGAMDVAFYLNGTTKVATIMASAENLELVFSFTGIHSNEEIQEYTERFFKSFAECKIMEIELNSAKLAEVLSDFNAVNTTQEAYIVFGENKAQLQSLQEDNGEPIYVSSLGETTRKMTVKKEELEKATRKFPIIPTNMASMLRAFEKFDTIHADNITLNVYLVAMSKAQYNYVLELTSNQNFRGWMTVTHQL